MRIELTEQQQQLREEVAGYFDRLMTPERKAGLAFDGGEFADGDVYLEVIRTLGADGWLGMGWPEEFGGQGRSMVEQLIFSDAAAVAGVAVPYLTINTIGPTLMRYGTREQQEYFLPKILRGELHFSIGYSEPEAGTDLASLRTRAELVGTPEDGEFVINGQKMWTSQVKYADWIWLACRTDPSASKHRGLSIILVPTDAAGFSHAPVDTVAGLRTSTTYFDDVRVPASNLVGEYHGGWRLMTAQLNRERVALFSSAAVAQAIDLVTDWARETTGPGGRRLIDQEWVRLLLGRARAMNEALTLMNWEIAAQVEDVSPAQASATKVLGSENALTIYRMLMEIVGPTALLPTNSPAAVLAGRLERAHRTNLILTFGGGANEVQRDLISRVALGQPHR
ncbi:acyl-CoA dehydrogenase family protein [Enemella sp. A6]|uniref:acyl-CoA dehydrogenase family protein n=1 Tax=Enemella sp. A6 TaxID=3440152 RepID=UPI003EB9BFE1